jgi:hypothetical protein
MINDDVQMTMLNTMNLERTYLKTSLSWLDARLERLILRWQLAGQDPTDRFRGLYVSDSKALELVHQEFGMGWGAGLGLPPNTIEALETREAAALREMERLEEEARSSGAVLHLKAVQTIFDLSALEWWAFVVCLAPALDLRYERIYGYLQDDVTQTFASVDLLLTLLVPEDEFRLQYLPAFDTAGTLRIYRLIIPVEDPGKPVRPLRQSFRVEPGLINWLLGEYTPSAELGEEALFYPALEKSTETVLFDFYGLPQLPDQEMLMRVHPFLSFHGPDVLQQELAALKLARSMERPLLEIKTKPEEDHASALLKLQSAVRDARLQNALLFVQGCDFFIDHDGCLSPEVCPTFFRMEDTLLLGSEQAFHFDPDMPGNDSPLMRVQFEKLTTTQRAQLWKALLAGVSDHLDEDEWIHLSGQFDLNSGQIVAAASSAMSHALQCGRELQPLDLFEAARLHSGHHLADLAHKIEPRYEWDDLVLPETPKTMLMEMVRMVQSRPLVLETWGLGKKLASGSGVSALFSGPPGTGKTLAAQIMANQLGIDLYRIDLSTVVSKYIGETEKNLEIIFREASQSNAILFFDEADSIFGKRSEVKDAHDRYANIEVGYLLQRMENYSGVAILATNLQANLDEAFTRRLQFIISFPFPDETYRKQIWEVLMPPDLPVSGKLDTSLMAKRFKVSGGSIRNIIVSAAYLAAADGGKLTMDHLLHGTRREFQKMGRLIQDDDFSLSSKQGE